MEVFPENGCPEAAHYCGCYSLANYVDYFQWQEGGLTIDLATLNTAENLGGKT